MRSGIPCGPEWRPRLERLATSCRRSAALIELVSERGDLLAEQPGPRRDRTACHVDQVRVRQREPARHSDGMNSSQTGRDDSQTRHQLAAQVVELEQRQPPRGAILDGDQAVASDPAADPALVHPEALRQLGNTE